MYVKKLTKSLKSSTQLIRESISGCTTYGCATYGCATVGRINRRLHQPAVAFALCHFSRVKRQAPGPAQPQAHPIYTIRQVLICAMGAGTWSWGGAV